uniref:CSON014409 protein n=1 Tax=Culicoides sonorensis TaxID=179676 RepID=A0A336LHG7_CULSO
MDYPEQNKALAEPNKEDMIFYLLLSLLVLAIIALLLGCICFCNWWCKHRRGGHNTGWQNQTLTIFTSKTKNKYFVKHRESKKHDFNVK